MQNDFLVIGAGGMQGRIVTRDLLEHGYGVMLADLSDVGCKKYLTRFPKATFQVLDLRNASVIRDVIRQSGARVVVNCAEGDWNDEVYCAALECGVHVLDLGSDIPMTKTQLAMDDAFRDAGLVGITGCGSTPGINNVMLHHAAQTFQRIDTVEAGFAWDANIKEFVVPFSIESIMEELCDSADYLEDGVWKQTLPRDSEVTREFRAIGTQRCFIVRHPETYTFAHYLAQKGIRTVRFYAGFPEHSLRALLTLADLGFGKKTSVSVDGADVRPVDVAAQVLARRPIPNGYEETENLWVHITGEDAGGATRTMIMECIVPTLPDWKEAGCNIDTGLPMSIMAQMVHDGRVTARGSFAPGHAIPAEGFLREIAERGMTIYQDGEVLYGPRVAMRLTGRRRRVHAS